MLLRAIVLALLFLSVLAAIASGRPAAAADTAALLARYEPVVFLYRSDWKPSTVEPFFAAADLERRSGTGWRVVRHSPPASALAGGAGDLRLDTRGCTPQVDQDPCYARRPGAATVYGRVWVSPTAAAGIGSVLQYWFFYPLDDWRDSRAKPGIWHMHEGDWELVSVALGADDSPVSVACAQHNLGVVRSWGRVRTAGGTHSIVYVALGSHASYFTVGFHGRAGLPHVIPPRFTGVPLAEPDFTSAESSYGPRGTAASPLGLVDISAGTLPWLSFAGSWGDGEYVLLGRKTPAGTVFTHLRVGSSPPGPAFHRSWRDPLIAFRTWPADDGH